MKALKGVYIVWMQVIVNKMFLCQIESEILLLVMDAECVSPCRPPPKKKYPANYFHIYFGLEYINR